MKSYTLILRELSLQKTTLRLTEPRKLSPLSFTTVTIDNLQWKFSKSKPKNLAIQISFQQLYISLGHINSTLLESFKNSSLLLFPFRKLRKYSNKINQLTNKSLKTSNQIYNRNIMTFYINNIWNIWQQGEWPCAKDAQRGYWWRCINSKSEVAYNQRQHKSSKRLRTWSSREKL